MTLRLFLVTIAALCACPLFAELDYGKLAKSLNDLRTDKKLTAGLPDILDAAKSDDDDDIVTRCMALYALRAGTLGNTALCQSAFQSLCNRHPDCETVKYLKSLALFPEPCKRCGGVGKIESVEETNCYNCRGTGLCPRCGGVGKINWQSLNGTSHTHVEMPAFTCPVCRGSGKCRVCLGSPTHQTKSFVKCPECNGIAKGVDRAKAASGFIKVGSELSAILKDANDCAAEYTAAMELKNPEEQLKALTACQKAHPKAVNASAIKETLKNVQTAVAEQKKKAAEQKREITETHSKELENIRVSSETAPAAVALQQLNSFVASNPDSPLIKEARQLQSDLEAKAAAERKSKEEHKRWIWTGVALGGLFALTWLASFIKENFFRKQVVHVRRPRQSDVDQSAVKADSKIEFSSDLHDFVAQQLTATLEPATKQTPQADRVVCPDCGAELECPPAIRNQTVTCSACHQTFKVQ
jgi:hypothetical protein